MENEQKKSEREVDRNHNDGQFLTNFHEHYIQSIYGSLEEISVKLKDKFILEFNSGPVLSENSNVYIIDINFNFEHSLKKIEVNFIVDDGQKSITITSKKHSSKDVNVENEDYIRFQGSLESFKDINLRSEITQILHSAF